MSATEQLTPELAAQHLAAKPMHRRPVPQRYVLADAFAGRRVRLVDDLHRDGSEERTFVGELVGMARNYAGTTSSLVIIRDDEYGLVSVSSARVSTIELVAP